MEFYNIKIKLQILGIDTIDFHALSRICTDQRSLENERTTMSELEYRIGIGRERIGRRTRPTKSVERNEDHDATTIVSLIDFPRRKEE